MHCWRLSALGGNPSLMDLRLDLCPTHYRSSRGMRNFSGKTIWTAILAA